MPQKVRPLLCYVTDRRALGAAATALPETTGLLEAIRRAVTADADWIQIREKDLPARELRGLAANAIRVAGSRSRVFVNDRLDVALTIAAAGVHLGAASLPVAEVRRWCRAGRAPADFLIGASCHSLDEARAAAGDGADYLFFGPVFSTPSKSAYGPPQGVARLEAVCRSVRVPVLAIGGITAKNAGECFLAGAAGIAAIRLFQETADPAEAVARIRAAE